MSMPAVLFVFTVAALDATNAFVGATFSADAAPNTATTSSTRIISGRKGLENDS